MTIEDMKILERKHEMAVVDRGGKDRNGKPIGNWKGALKRFCTTKKNNRSNA